MIIRELCFFFMRKLFKLKKNWRIYCPLFFNKSPEEFCLFEWHLRFDLLTKLFMLKWWRMKTNSSTVQCVFVVPLCVYLTYEPFLCMSKWNVSCVDGLNEKQIHFHKITVTAVVSHSCWCHTWPVPPHFLHCLRVNIFCVAAKVCSRDTYI